MTKTDDDERVSTWLAELARAPVPGEDELRALAPGDLLGRDRYRIHSELGRGGMGIVYEAGDTKLNRRVALKTHQIASVDARRRLLVEAQAMAKLSHPHVVAVHDVGEFEGGVFLVAALIRGGDLDTWRTAERSWSEVVDAYVEAGRGLAYAHAAGLIHRDFKPSNVLVGLDGRSQVTDFGVAVPIDSDTRGDEPSGRRTEREVATSSLIGTPAYMAPEQFFGAPADARSDQFSFCVALCEGLLGHRPYRTTSKELLTEPPRVRASKLHVPRRILRVIARGVSVEPSKRFPSMDALLDALERARAPRRTAWIAAGGLGLVGLGAVATADLEPPCSEGIEPPLRTWSASGRLRLKRVFLDDDQAKKLWPRMERSVDVFTTRWVDTATSACEARTTTDAFTHHAQRCLYEVAREADATLASLQRAPAAASREGPVRVEEWVNPAECLRPKFVLAAPVIPLLVRPRVRELEEALAAIGNDVSSGANAEDLARRLDEIRPELESLARSYPALRARLAMIEATLSRRDGRKMEAALKRAYHHARAASHAGYAAEAADRLVQLLAIQLGESKSAIEWAEVAQAEAARDGVSSERRVSIALAVAIAYDTAGRWDDAATGYEDALRAADRLTGTAHDHHRASILISLSGFEGARGDLDRAIETGMEAVNTLERLDGGPSRQSLSALGNVGLALDSAGRLDEAQALFERELRERTAIIGPDDPEHLAALINLGLVALHQGRTQEARARWTAADVVVERYYGKRHPDRADIALDLAWMDDAAGKHAEAERRYAWATRVFEETLGHEAEKTLLAHSGLSTARLRQGKIQAACRPLDALTETARGALGETRALAILLEARGDCAAARDKPAEAESVYRSALDVMNQSSEPAEAQADLHLKLASTLWDQGKESDAQALVGALAVDTKSVEAWREAH